MKAIQGFETLKQEAAWQDVKSTSALTDKAKRANDYLKKFPYSDHVVEARQILAEAANAKSWDDFVKQYDSMMIEGRVSDAAELLVGRNPETPALTMLKTRFSSQALEKLKQVIQQKNSNSEWEKGIEELNSANQWPPELVSEQVQPVIRELREQLEEAWDRALYQTALNSKTTDNLQTYLAQAPLKSMKTTVQEYLDYLAKQQGQLDLTLTLVKVYWNPNIARQKDVQYVVSINNVEVIERTSDQGTWFNRGEDVSIDATGKFKGRLKDDIKLTVVAKGVGFINDVVLGTGNKKLAVGSLNGLSLNIKDDDNNVSTVEFSLRGMPKAPEMPAWRK